MSLLSRVSKRPRRSLLVAVGLLASAAVLAPNAGAGAAERQANFQLWPSSIAGQSVVPCLAPAGQTPTVSARVKKGSLNDTLQLSLSHFKPGIAFDLFTVERSNQNADGTPRVIPNFGMAWYQSDVQVQADGTASVTVKTILLDQIFGFDPDVALNPTQTLHLGFWFNNPADAVPCGFAAGAFTPFNGEHHAGPLAFITRPNATTDLGPLCTKPSASAPFHCNP
jgi:hypothetical protein